ncbi:MAG: hypothetical protein U0802_00500 [Candidatus Binatia bacterium]
MLIEPTQAFAAVQIEQRALGWRRAPPPIPPGWPATSSGAQPTSSGRGPQRDQALQRRPLLGEGLLARQRSRAEEIEHHLQLGTGHEDLWIAVAELR